MAIKVEEFTIQAKIIENDEDMFSNEESGKQELPSSVKQEIIDECVDKIKELLERERGRY